MATDPREQTKKSAFSVTRDLAAEVAVDRQRAKALVRKNAAPTVKKAAFSSSAAFSGDLAAPPDSDEKAALIRRLADRLPAPRRSSATGGDQDLSHSSRPTGPPVVVDPSTRAQLIALEAAAQTTERTGSASYASNVTPPSGTRSTPPAESSFAASVAKGVLGGAPIPLLARGGHVMASLAAAADAEIAGAIAKALKPPVAKAAPIAKVAERYTFEITRRKRT